MSLTPEDRARRAASEKARRHARSPEKVAADKAREKAKWDRLSPEAKAAKRAAQSIANKASRIRRLGRLSHEEQLADKRRTRERKLVRDFGIESKDYEALLALQDGKCAVCKAAPDWRALAVDHCHATGQVRGLLCYKCNIALGMLNENPVIVQAALAYLTTQSTMNRYLSSKA